MPIKVLVIQFKRRECQKVMSYVYSRPYHESYRKLRAQYEADTEVESNRKYERKKYRIASSHITSKCIGNCFAESTLEKQNAGWYRFMAASSTIQTSSMHEDLLSSQSRQPATCAANLALPVRSKVPHPRQPRPQPWYSISSTSRPIWRLNLWATETMGDKIPVDCWDGWRQPDF